MTNNRMPTMPARRWFGLRPGPPHVERRRRRPRGRAVIALAITILAAWTVVAIAAPLLAPHDPLQQTGSYYTPPSSAHWLGTDQLGRDILSRIIYGARLSLPLAVVIVALALLLGGGIGLIAGYLGKWADESLMRLTDLVFAFPPIILAMVVTAAFGPSARNAVLALVLVSWPTYARVVRSAVLSIRGSDFLHASRLLGVGPWRALARDVLPNSVGPSVVLASLELGNAVLMLASLSFLGLGPRPPAPEWGAMIAAGASDLSKWWVSIVPGIAILTTVLAFNLLGDAVRDWLDPTAARGQASADRRRDQRRAGPPPARTQPVTDSEPQNAPLLDIRGLSVTLPGPAGPLPVIKNLDLQVGAGEFVGIAGESGSGKSLTALTLLNLLPPGARVDGSIRFEGTELTELDAHGWQRVRGSGIAMVFQESATALHPMLTVGLQLTEHLRATQAMSKAAARTRAVELLDQVRIPQPRRALRAYPHQFSGGMRQRIAIASALACDPRLLIADEPTTALDVTVQAGILALLDELRRDNDLSVLFITHDLGVLSSLTQRAYVFYAGRVMESGATAEVLTQPAHPYTGALLGARPHGLSTQQTLRAIPGTPVVPGQEPPGCPFEPRCGYARDECRTGPPPVEAIGADRTLACVVAPDLAAAR